METQGIELIWTVEREAHIQRHGVDPDECDEVLGHHVLIRHYRASRYLVFGQTQSGRLLFLVIDLDDRADWYCATARDMVPWERRYYQRGGK